MKLIAQTLTDNEASLLCERISLIEQTRARVKEILQIEGELRDSKLANRVASELLRGNVIRVDNQRMKVSNLTPGQIGKVMKDLQKALPVFDRLIGQSFLSEDRQVGYRTILQARAKRLGLKEE
jgi:hypothetical protein